MMLYLYTDSEAHKHIVAAYNSQ